MRQAKRKQQQRQAAARRLMIEQMRQRWLEKPVLFTIPQGIGYGVVYLISDDGDVIVTHAEYQILSLRWQDVDLKAGWLQVRHTVGYYGKSGFVVGEPKTESSRRTIVLPDFLVEKLKLHRTSQLEMRLQAGLSWVDNDLVFCNKRGGFFPPPTIAYQFNKVLKDVGFSHMRFHDVRRFGDCKIALKGQKVRAMTF